MPTPIEQSRSAATVILSTVSHIVAVYSQQENWYHPQRGLTVPALQFGEFLREVIEAQRAVNAVANQLIDAKRDDHIVRLGTHCERTAHQVAIKFARQVGSIVWLNLWLDGDDGPYGTAFEPWPIDGLDSDRHLREFQQRWPNICDALSKIKPDGIGEIYPLILLESRRAQQIEPETNSAASDDGAPELQHAAAEQELSELPAEIGVFRNEMFDQDQSNLEESTTIEQLPSVLVIESEWTGWIEKKRLWAHFKANNVEYGPSGWTTLIRRLVKEQQAIDNEPGRGKRTIRVRLSCLKTRGIPCL